MSPRIGVFHALQGSIDPLDEAFAVLWPEAEVVHLYDGSLYVDYRKEGDVTVDITQRIRTLLHYLAGVRARGILFTGSLFSQAVEEGRRHVHVPVLTAYEAMIEEALEEGNRLALLATFPATIAAVTNDIERMARESAVDAEIESRLVEGAFDALQAGDRERHDSLVAQAVEKVDECDVIILAQHSMSPARKLIADKPGRRLLTSSETAVRKLKRLVEDK